MTAHQCEFGDDPVGENRRAPRYPFGMVQQLGMIVDGQMPSPDSFESVRCVDISRSGFAFYRKTLPETGEVIIALGEEPELTYLAARVVHWMEMERFEHRFFRVGCEFIGRVSREGDTLVFTRRRDLETAFLLVSGQETRDAPSGNT